MSAEPLRKRFVGFGDAPSRRFSDIPQSSPPAAPDHRRPFSHEAVTLDVARLEIEQRRAEEGARWESAVCSRLRSVVMRPRETAALIPPRPMIPRGGRSPRECHTAPPSPSGFRLLTDPFTLTDVGRRASSGRPQSAFQPSSPVPSSIELLSSPDKVNLPEMPLLEDNLHMHAPDFSAKDTVEDEAPLPVQNSLPRFHFGDLPCYFCKAPKKALIVKRKDTPEVTNHAAEVCNFLTEDKDMTVVVEPEAFEELKAAGALNITTWTSHGHLSASELDFAIAMGGDGTLLWVSRLFPGAVPPVIGVSMGSLGYLAQYAYTDLGKAIDTLIGDSFRVQLRCRLKACVRDANKTLVAEFAAMNECVLERGSCSQLTALDVYCNERFFTTASADGLVIATPTGSTAYSMSAGGSMIHPVVPCMLFTPICPHSLSFRPLVLPDTVVLELYNPRTSRGSVWLSVDGGHRTEVKKGMSVVVSMSAFPMPLVVPQDSTGDPWLSSLTRILNWNQRIRQGVLFGPNDAEPVTPATFRNLPSSISQIRTPSSTSHSELPNQASSHLPNEHRSAPWSPSANHSTLMCDAPLPAAVRFGNRVSSSPAVFRDSRKGNPAVFRDSRNLSRLTSSPKKLLSAPPTGGVSASPTGGVSASPTDEASALPTEDSLASAELFAGALTY